MFVGHTVFKEKLLKAVEKKLPFCATSIGDSELAVAAHPECFDIPIHKYLLKISGVTENINPLKAELVASIPQNDFIFAHNGLQEDTPGYTDYHNKVPQMMKYFGYSVPLIDTQYRYRLFTSGEFFTLFEGKKVLLVGNKAPHIPTLWSNPLFKSQYSEFGFEKVEIAGTVSTPNYNPFNDINDIIQKCMSYDYDIALVGAGTCANVICTRLKREGKVALDIGWVMDALIGRPPGREELLNMHRRIGSKSPLEMYA